MKETKANMSETNLNNIITRTFNVLKKEYISLGYLTFADDTNPERYDSIYSNGFFEQFCPEYHEGLTFEERGKVLSNSIIHPDDKYRFNPNNIGETIFKKLNATGSYNFIFRIMAFNETVYLKMEIIADRQDGKLVGAVVSITNADKEVNDDLLKKAEIADAYANADRLVMGRTAELIEKNRELERINGETVELLGDVIELRDEESGQHVKRVKSYTNVLANEIKNSLPEYNLTDYDIETFTSASTLHDVGKIMIPDAILLKPGKLTDEEFEIMKTHTSKGLEVLNNAPKSWPAAFTQVAKDIAHFHHEKWDGRGYPMHLKEDEIPISAQIVSIADCYDALTSERTYKKAFSSEKAYEMITGGQCGAFSEKILKCFVNVRAEFEKILSDPEYLNKNGQVSNYGEFKLNGLNILLVDDNEFNLEISKEVLEDEGAKVTVAMNGLEAVDLFTSAGKFDAILMDVVMPEMNGIEATKEIRKIEGDAKIKVPIIALTAEASAENTEMLNEAGCNASMAKPLVIGELTRILVSCMSNVSLFGTDYSDEPALSNTDALTKLKNIAAFTNTISALNEDIKDGNNINFAIVEIDLNNLNLINNTLGHNAGNKYLINACDITRDVFRLSPIYRIGGDEIAIILRGKDYEKREKLFNLLKEKEMHSKTIKDVEFGRTSFAYGMAEYNPNDFATANDVLKKAEEEMLKVKKEMLEISK